MSDEIVWQIINNQHCSFKLKTKTQNFCRNEYNSTGYCNRQSCPLANSRSSTVRTENGRMYLYIKVPERAHLPNRWWSKKKLSSNYEKALQQIEEDLLYFPKFQIHKCKQRLTRLTQVAIRSRRLAKEEERLGERLVPKLAPKIRRREETRERKAESAAKVERAIERELIERLRSGAYGDKPLNVEEGIWKKVLRGLERAENGEDLELEAEEDEAEREEEEEAEEGVGEVEYVSDLDEDEEEQEMEDFEDWLEDESAEEDDDDSEEDDEDDEEASENSVSDDEAGGTKKIPSTGAKRKRPAASQPKARKKPARVEIEYETEPPQREGVYA